MNENHCPLCSDEYTLVQERYEEGGKEYEPVWYGTCHAWHENVYEGNRFIGAETNLDREC